MATGPEVTPTFQIPESGILVDPGWLVDHQHDPDVRIADCRYDDDYDKAHAAYLGGHVPGAVHVYWPRDLAVGTAPVANLLPTPEQAGSALSRLGISNDTLVVAYDAEGGHHAARLWLVLAYYGHTRFKLVNGGIQGWGGRPVATDEVTPPAGRFVPGPANDALRIRADELVSRLGEAGLALADVRRASEYDGSEVRAARGGRIPGGRHVPWQDSVNSDWTFRSLEQIRARHEAAGITADQEVVTYCQGGVRAAHSALALLLAGYPRVRVYDGSWAEWGNNRDLPIA